MTGKASKAGESSKTGKASKAGGQERARKSSSPATARGKKKTARGAASKGSHAGGANARWVKNVTTDATHPPAGLFTKSAAVIARNLASKKTSPKGPGSGMRMLTYFMNRAGKGMSAARRRELEKAKRLLSERIQRQKKAA
jgi:tRNA(adenine34) deaminase